jgi:aryl-alcohol dehydrogenase
MSRSTLNAAVIREPGGPFLLERLELDDLAASEVLVNVVATGLCHTDLLVQEGTIPLPLPMVLGHEGAGVVAAVGKHVTKVKPGDHVVMTFLCCASCRSCMEGHPACCENFRPLNFAGERPNGSHALLHPAGTPLNDRFFAQSSLATRAIASERNVVRVRTDAPLELLGPLGCGIQTGAGTVLNVLRLQPGASITVFGSGAVGLSALLAAVLAGATTIVAVDLVAERLELARQLGATHTIDGRAEKLVESVLEISGGGTDFSIDTTGSSTVARSAIEVVRQRGHCVMVGASKRGTQVAFDANHLVTSNKTIRGVIEGDSVPDLFIPQLVDHYMNGRFPFDRLTRFYPLDRINEAAEDSRKGRVVKPIIRMQGG